MAEDLRPSDSAERVSNTRTAELVAECRRQEESCLYTSTSLYIWLRQSRALRRVFIVAPIVLGALATWSVLDQPDATWVKWLTASFALLAGLIPAIFEALKLDVHIDEISRHAAEFKNLQDRFRQAGSVIALGPWEDFKTAFDVLMERMDTARSASLTPPERCFEAARKKIGQGHYGFEADTAKRPHSTPPAGT